MEFTLGRQYYRDRAQAVILLLTAFAVRFVAAWWLGSWTNPVPLEYENIANNLLAGQGFVYQHLGNQYRAYVLPMYPLFLTVIYAITNHSTAAVVVVQCLVSAVACLQVQQIGVLVFRDSSVARLGAWLVAFHPGLIVYASSLSPTTLDLFAFLLVIVGWLKLLRGPTWGMAIYVGFIIGFALLARATILVFILLAAGWFLRFVVLRHMEAVKRLAVVVAVAVLLVAPWLVRNAIHFHVFPIYQTTASEVFWRGNNPLASGSAYLPNGRAVIAETPEEFRRQLLELDELGQSKFFRQEAWRFIQEHPLQTLTLYGKKLFYFWWFSPQSGLIWPSFYLQGYQLYYVFISVLILIGFWSARRSFGQPEGLLLISFVLSIALVQSVYYVEGRHRWTVEPVLLLLSAAGALRLLGSGCLATSPASARTSQGLSDENRSRPA